jgi:hypothetical protein
MNKSIENDRKLNIEFNNSELGTHLFDCVINFIKILQHSHFELVAILYLKLLNNENIKESNYFNELKEILYKINKKINLLELSYYLQLNVVHHKFSHLARELVECHFSKTNDFVIINSPPQYIRIPMFD